MLRNHTIQNHIINEGGGCTFPGKSLLMFILQFLLVNGSGSVGSVTLWLPGSGYKGQHYYKNLKTFAFNAMLTI